MKAITKIDKTMNVDLIMCQYKFQAQLMIYLRLLSEIGKYMQGIKRESQKKNWFKQMPILFYRIPVNENEQD